MDGSGPREGGGVMKPMILRVGVALVISATSLILARFVFRKEDNEVTSSASDPGSSSSSPEEEDKEIESIGDHQKEMELRIKHHCNLKDQEVMLMEKKSMLVLEKSQLDFFLREVSAMQEELKSGQDLVIVHLKLVGDSLNELKITNNVVKELEGQVKDLKAKEELSMKSKPEMVSLEEYRKVVKEYEDLKKDFDKVVNEKINLIWSNACLRHKVMKNGTNEHRKLQELLMEDQADTLPLTVVADEHHGENNHDDDDHHHHHETSKRKWIMKTLKRCVGGNEKGKAIKLEERCFRRQSCTVEPEEEVMFHSRRSCSSV